MNVYSIKFEDPDHGFYYRNIATKAELDLKLDKNWIQHKLNIYNAIVDIELVISEVIKL